MKYKFDAKGDDVLDHGLKYKGVDMEGEDTEGHALRARFEDTGPEADVEGHSFRYKLDVECDDVGAHLAHLEGAEVTGKDAEGSAWTLPSTASRATTCRRPSLRSSSTTS